MCGAILKQNIELRNESNKTVSQIGPNGQALELRIQTKRQFQHNFNNLNYPISIIDIVIDFDLNSHFPRIEKFCFELFPLFFVNLFCFVLSTFFFLQLQTLRGISKVLKWHTYHMNIEYIITLYYQMKYLLAYCVRKKIRSEFYSKIMHKIV